MLFEGEFVGNGGQLRVTQILDQFQWDVELEASRFQAGIPSDYTPLE
jgi:hypothetical protein